MKTIKKLSFLLIPVLLFACKSPPKETIYIPEEMKPYIMYPEGSYWVYEDSITGHIDSFYLKSQEVEIKDGNPHDVNFEILTQRFDCNDNCTSLYKTNVSNTIYYSTTCIYSNFLLANYINIETGDSIEINHKQYLKKIKEIPEMNFNGFTFYNINVISEFIIWEDTIFDYEQTSYWCKDIGMIKLEDYWYSSDGISLNDTLIVRKLINYHINK